MNFPRTYVCLFVLLAAGATGCGSFQKAEIDDPRRQPKLTGTAYINAGDEMHFIVDVRASRIAGPEEYLPLQIAVLNRSKQDLKVNRESFSLEGPGRQLLPLVTYAEFEKGYPRHRVDLRIGNDFLEAMNGKYPSPPFTKRPLEFFPLRESGVVPRTEISLRQGEMAIGFVYFRLPDASFLPDEGRCKLLLRPIDSDSNFVVDLVTYKEPKKGRG